MEESKNTPNSYCYDLFIRTTLGRYLPACLQQVTELKPADPIEYIANWLYKVYDSRLYYQAKVDYMRDICQLNESVNQEKRDHEAKMKPFVEAVEAERWNYLMSLHAEQQALEEVMAQDNAEVDEVSKLRLLEVQLLIKDEEGQVKGPHIRKPPARVATVKLLEQDSEPDTPMPASARESTQPVTERNTIVMDETPSVEETASGRLVRRKLSSEARLDRVSRRPTNHQTLSSVGVSTLHRGLSSASTPQSKSSKDINRKQKRACAGGSQEGRTSFFRYVLDESGSFVRDSLKSSLDSSDSEAEQQDELEAYEWKQQMRVMSATNRCYEVAMSYSDDEDSDIQENETGEELRDRSLPASSSVINYSITGGSRLPVIIQQGKHCKEKVAMSLCDDNEESFSKTHYMTRHAVPRETQLSASYSGRMEYQEDFDEASEEIRTQKEDYCGKFHLPPVRRHGDTRKVVLSDDDRDFSERQDCDVSEQSASSEQVVHLPAISAGTRTTGTLIMTNNGHIAFVNKELGVIAPNSLKIRSVHPIDKPEMWARRNFRCQSFYDHELYSEADHPPVDSEEEERWRRPEPRMSMEELAQTPDCRRKSPKAEVDY